MDAPDTVSFDVRQMASGAGPFLCDQLAALLLEHPDARNVVCDVRSLVRPTPADLDHLARLRVVAARMERALRLRNVGPQLRLLLMLTGLDEVFGGEARPGASDPGPPDLRASDPGTSDPRASDPVSGLEHPDDLAAGPGPQPRGQLEQREQPLGVEVVPDPGDPAV